MTFIVSLPAYRHLQTCCDNDIVASWRCCRALPLAFVAVHVSRFAQAFMALHTYPRQQRHHPVRHTHQVCAAGCRSKASISASNGDAFRCKRQPGHRSVPARWRRQAELAWPGLQSLVLTRAREVQLPGYGPGGHAGLHRRAPEEDFLLCHKIGTLVLVDLGGN